MGDNDIKPEEYDLVTNPQTGEYYLEDGYLTVQCNKTGNMVEVLFDNVANFYNLEKIDNGDGTFTIRSKNVKKKVPPATSPGGKGIKEWEINETKRIIQLTTAYTNDVGPMKRFATKKVMWKCIAEKLTGEFNTHVTPTQVENRMKTVSKINKKRVEHNRTSGNNKMITPYDSDFDLLSQKDPTVDPILLTQDGEIPGGSGSGNPSRAPGYSAIDTSSAVETNSSESGSKNHPDGETETVANESDGDIDMADQEVQKQKADKKKKKKKNNLSELYLNECEARASEREQQRKEKEVAREKATTDRMERFLHAQQRKDQRHAEKISLLKELIGVLKPKDKDDSL